MLHRTFVPSLIAFSLSMVAATEAVAVGAQRTFVASSGNDANPCSLAAPCRGFAAAITQTVSGGEIIVLDSAAYGPVSITQAVAIIAPAGVYAGISVFSGVGVTIAAGASDVVVLRGLTINGLGGTTGISVGSVGAVHIENCEISGMSTNGISTNTTGKLFVKDTVVRENVNGISLSSSTTPGIAALDRVHVLNNSNVGIWSLNAAASVRDGVVSGNLVGMIAGSFSAGQTPTLDVESSVIAENVQSGIQGANAAGHGIISVANSSIVGNAASVGQGVGGGASDVVRVSNTTIIGNGNGVGSAVISVGGNTVEGNNFSNTFTTTLSKK